MSNAAEKIESKIIKLQERKKELEAALAQEKAKLRAQGKRAKMKRLKEVGELAEKAGILHLDDEFLLGGMLRLAEILEDPERQNAVREKGRSFIGRSAC